MSRIDSLLRAEKSKLAEMSEADLRYHFTDVMRKPAADLDRNEMAAQLLRQAEEKIKKQDI